VQKFVGRKKLITNTDCFGSLSTSPNINSTVKDLTQLLNSELGEYEFYNDETDQSVMARQVDPLRIITGQCHYINMQNGAVDYGREAYKCFNQNDITFRLKPNESPGAWVDTVDGPGKPIATYSDYLLSLVYNKTIYGGPVGAYNGVNYINLKKTKRRSNSFWYKYRRICT
jgi:hypothetical protein